MNDKILCYPACCLRRFRPGMVCRMALFLLICLLPGTLWAAAIYYVDASYTGVEGGTIANPWKNISSITGIGAGDTIKFKRGEVWYESLVIPSSGTLGSPITFEAYPDTTDPLPVFDGTTTRTWSPLSGNKYTTNWASGDPGMLEYKDAPKPPIVTLNWSSSKVVSIQPGAVLIQKKDGYAYCNFWVTSATATTVSGITFFRDSTAHWIANVTDSIELRQVEDGKEAKYRLTLDQGMHVDPGSLQKNGDWYWDSNTLYLYSDTDPTSIVRISDLITGIYAENKQYLTIQDIAVQGFQDTGVHLDNTNNSIVQRMQVKNIGAKVSAPSHKTGIMLHHSSGNQILKNQVDASLRVGIGIFTASSSPPSQNNIISGNVIKYSGSSGVSLGAPEGNENTVSSNTITGNTILYSNRYAWDSGGVYALYVGSNTISNNTIMYGGSQYLRSSGILIDQRVADMIITDNIIENNSFAGIAVTGTGHAITGNRLTNNGLSSSASAQIVFFPVVENVSATTVTGNTLVADTGKRLFLEAIDSNLNPVSNTVDNNTYRSRSASTFSWIDWQTSWENVWIDFDAWKSTTGYDAGSHFFFITDPPPPDPPSGKSINSTYLLLLK